MKRIVAGPLSLAFAAVAFCAQPAAGAPPMQWVRYVDPAEHAFAIEAPQGWEVSGGMYRFGYSDVRWMIDARSPDAKVIIRIDDVSVPPYVLPGPNHPYEGQAYNKPQQSQMVVERYRNGRSFANTYANFRFRRICRNPKPQRFDWRPRMPPEFHFPNVAAQTEGSVVYACDTSDGPRFAAVFARTSGFRQGYWTADPVISVLTAPQDADMAQAVVQQMLDSFRKNPQWVQYQTRLANEGDQMAWRDFQNMRAQVQASNQAPSSSMNQQVSGFEARMNAQQQQVSGFESGMNAQQQQASGFESRMNAQQQQVSSFGNTLTGVQIAVDPTTGLQSQVWSGPGANYYRDGVGHTVNSNALPDIQYHKIDVPPN